jgi:peptidoglycan biosynthesis protein MviN/MurJ (putative lipid II flippase)
MFHKTPIKLSTKFDLNSRAITLFYLLQKKRELLALKAKKHTNRMVWLGLGLMSIQAGILARLTWFDYSWDIVEPISYFVSYSAVIGVYAYFVLTRKVNFNTIFN